MADQARESSCYYIVVEVDTFLVVAYHTIEQPSARFVVPPPTRVLLADYSGTPKPQRARRSEAARIIRERTRRGYIEAVTADGLHDGRYGPLAKGVAPRASGGAEEMYLSSLPAPNNSKCFSVFSMEQLMGVDANGGSWSDLDASVA